MGYSLQPRRAYDAVKFGIKGTDYTIVLKNAGTRHYQQLVNEFTSIMNDIVDETLGNADPNDYVRFVLKSSDFDRPLNTSYQRRSQVSGAWLSELAGKLLQSHESLDLDNNLTLHVQHVAIPRGNGGGRVDVNMWTNILLKRCVLTNVSQHNHIPCFGYALVLAINRLFTDLTGVQHLAANENRMINEVSVCFKTSGVQYGPVDCTQYHLFLPCLPQNSRLIDHVCNLSYCSYCSKSVKPDHQCFIEVKMRSNVKSWIYVFYDFECTQNMIDTETKRPVHEVNYCIAMSICGKCPDDGSCDDCLPVRTFRGLGGQNALDKFCKWAFDHPVNEGAVFIAHNSSNYDAHFILSYLIRNGEYPEILANGGKLLEMKINTRNAKLIDSCCFIAMPLSRFSDTFNIPHTKGTFPHMFNVSDNYNYVGPLPALRYYDPNGMKEPLRTQLIEWHKAHENDVFDFAKEIHEYCKADVQLLKSGCIKFRNAFITDTGIDPFQSCTITSACMNVLRTSHLKPNSIARVPVSGYRSLRNYSN